MPRDPQPGDRDRRALERRDPRFDRRPHDADVRMERRDDLYRDLPSVANRSFGMLSAGDGRLTGAGVDNRIRMLKAGNPPPEW